MPHDSTADQRHTRLCLLGRWQLLAHGEDVGLGHREERLIALLGLVGRSSRLHVAGILWPESTDERALASLRRAVLQTQKRSPGVLQVDRLTIGLDPEVEVDVDGVRRAADATEDAIADGEAGVLLGRLVGAELLPDWYDDWAVTERENIEQLRLKALDRLARHALETGDLALTLEAAQAASDVDPLLESPRELAIRAHLDLGDVGSARREFDRYRDAVRDELDAPPSRAVLDLIEPVLAVGAPEPREETAPEPQVVAAARATEQTPPEPAVPATEPPVHPTVVPGPPPREPARTIGAGAAVARLLAVAALVLAAALAVVGLGHRPGDDRADRSGPQPTAMRVVPATMVRAGQIAVRPVGTAAGKVAFLVRSTLRPAVVRLEVRGQAGAGVVRRLVVRNANGRVLEVAGLAPGVHRWFATTAATTVTGRLRVPGEPVTPVTGTATSPSAASSTTASAPSASTTPASSSTPVPSTPMPSQEPRSTPTSGSAPSSTPTPVARPTGQPKDPGTRPPGPVG